MILPTAIRILGFPPWTHNSKQFGGSMVVHTLADGSALMTVPQTRRIERASVSAVCSQGLKKSILVKL